MNVQEQEYATYREVKARFAMNRFMLYSLAREGKIKSVSLRRPGKRWGIRLFHVPSVREFLESLEQEKAPDQPSRDRALRRKENKYDNSK